MGNYIIKTILARIIFLIYYLDLFSHLLFAVGIIPTVDKFSVTLLSQHYI